MKKIANTLLAFLLALVFALPSIASSFSGNLVGWWQNSVFSPLQIPGLLLWLDASDVSTITLNYNSTGVTGTGNPIGTFVITTSGDLTGVLPAGSQFRIGATDTYTVASITSTQITTVQPLSALYIARTIYEATVSQWNDKSGNGNNGTQGSGSAQPLYGPALFNSAYSGMSFNGSSDYMNFPTITLPADCEFIFVFVLPTNNSTSDFMMGNSGVNVQIASLAGGDCRLFVNGVFDFLGVDFYNFQMNSIYEIGRQGTTYNTALNGTLGTSATLPSGTIPINQLGATTNSNFAQMTLADCYIYSQFLGTSDRANLITYLNAKWGL